MPKDDDDTGKATLQSGRPKNARDPVRFLLRSESKQEVFGHIVRMLVFSHQRKLGTRLRKNPAVERSSQAYVLTR